MSFVLKITSPGGLTSTYDENGLTLFTSKYQAALAALRALPRFRPHATIGEGKALGRVLDSKPIGTEVVEYGYTFKIEEST